MKRRNEQSKNVNPYLKVQITNEIMTLENFGRLCELAAKKDDGTIDADEAKLLKKVDRYSKSFLKKLRKLV